MYCACRRSHVPSSPAAGAPSPSPEPFFAQALRAFLRLFPFQGLALDIALRVFLGSAALPTETQHIDRVMEAFARRYCECNPNVFGGIAKKRDVGEEGVSTEGTEESRTVEGAKRDGQEESDIPYVLAFSMVMLNTDHFNPNAKTKMCVSKGLRRIAQSRTNAVVPNRTKSDYLRNTRIDGVAPEILEVRLFCAWQRFSHTLTLVLFRSTSSIKSRLPRLSTSTIGIGRRSLLYGSLPLRLPSMRVSVRARAARAS